MASIVRKLYVSRSLRKPSLFYDRLFCDQVRHLHIRRSLNVTSLVQSRKLCLPQASVRLYSDISGSKFPNVELPEEVQEILQSSKVQKDEELKRMLKEIASDFANPTESSASVYEPQSVQSYVEHSWEFETIEKDDKTPGGVFNIDEMVQLLREENVNDICVIQVPEEKKYVDYFVIVSCRSTRHLQAVTQYVIQMHKQKKRLKDPFVRLEGKLTDDWMCIDFGNIVVHFFLTPTREVYELEKLWTLGSKHDDQLRHLAEQSSMFTSQIEDQRQIFTDSTEKNGGAEQSQSDRETK